MPTPPPPPIEGKEIPPRYWEELYRYIRSLELHGDSKTCTVNRDASGTRISVIGSAGKSQTVASPAADLQLFRAEVISGDNLSGYRCKITTADGSEVTKTVYPTFIAFDSTLPAGYVMIGTTTAALWTGGGTEV